MYDKIINPSDKYSALKVSPAIEQPGQVNEEFLKKHVKTKELSIARIEQYYQEP